jgi:hypothetical protein
MQAGQPNKTNGGITPNQIPNEPLNICFPPQPNMGVQLNSARCRIDCSELCFEN